MATTIYEPIETPPSSNAPKGAVTYSDADVGAPAEAGEPQYESEENAEYFRNVLNDPSYMGSALRFGGGVLQGLAMDPIEAAAEPVEALGKNFGVDLSKYVPGFAKDLARGTRQVAEKSTAGNIGRMVGGLAPAGIAARDIGLLSRSVERAPQTIRALERVGQSAIQGGLGSLLVPQGSDSKGIGDYLNKELEKTGISAGVGSLFGVLPAASRLARRTGEDWRGVVKPLYENLPYVGRYARSLRGAYGDPGFNTAMYDYILRPLRGTAAELRPPSEAGWNSVNQIRQHLGNTLDRIESTASWTHTRGSESIVRAATSHAVNTLPPALVPQYRNIIRSAFNSNLFNPTTGVYRGHLDPATFQHVVSQLRDLADGMNTAHPDQRLISHAIREFRDALMNSASMPIGMRDLWRQTNAAYARYARFREGLWIGNDNGIVPARNIETAMRVHDPFGYSTMDAEGQQIVQQAQNAMLLQRRAAMNALQGRPQFSPMDLARPAGKITAQQPFLRDDGDQ